VSASEGKGKQEVDRASSSDDSSSDGSRDSSPRDGERPRRQKSRDAQRAYGSRKDKRSAALVSQAVDLRAREAGARDASREHAREAREER